MLKECDLYKRINKTKYIFIVGVIGIFALLSLQGGKLLTVDQFSVINNEVNGETFDGKHHLPYSTCHQTYNIDKKYRRRVADVNTTYKYTPETMPLHKLSEEEPYKSRMIDIKRRCEKWKNDFKSRIDLSRFIFDHEHKVAMCVVPKNACTTMKRLMLFLQGKATLVSKDEIPVRYLDLSAGKIPVLSRYSKEKVEEILSSYTTFMVMRHPFERLVSAYNSKFHGIETVARVYKFKGRRMSMFLLRKKYPGYYRFRHYLKNEPAEFAKKLNMTDHELNDAEILHNSSISGEIRFKHFIQALGGIPRSKDKMIHVEDPHWRQQHALCNPCAIDYDYIIDFASLSVEGERLLKYLQKNDDPNAKKAHLPPPMQHPVDESVAKRMFREVEEQDIKKVEELYKNDFYLFDFNPHVF